MKPKNQRIVVKTGGMLAIALGMISVWHAAQAQNIQSMTIQQMVNSPLYLHQGGPLTQLFLISGIPGNPAASKANLFMSIQGVGFAGLPQAQAEYKHILYRLGMAQAVLQGNSFRLQQVGHHQIGGTASDPTLTFPVILQESPRPDHQGPWTDKGDYTLRLGYVPRAANPHFGPTPELATVALDPR